MKSLDRNLTGFPEEVVTVSWFSQNKKLNLW